MSPWRRQLPVHSPLGLDAIAAAFGGEDPRDAVRDELARRFGAGAVLLTDSGTSALALAMRAASMRREGLPCALPGYGCYDLVSAALAAGVQVVLYDIDPTTLQPDERSLDVALEHGVSAVVVVHQYGVPVPLSRLRTLVARAGAVLIEDAAQGAGGSVDGRALGAGGDFGVLSFGRGKGVTAGGGGALLASHADALQQPTLDRLLSDESGGTVFGIKLLAQWLLGRPALYAIPSAMPFLRLGETVFREPATARAMRCASARVLLRTLPLIDDEVAARQAHVAAITTRVAVGGRVLTPPGVTGAAAWLRLPVLGGRSDEAAKSGRTLGCVPGYPTALDGLPDTGRIMAITTELQGCRELARRLWTVPVHSLVNDDDVTAIVRWLESLPA